jgi:colanic acid/amylovoran biosynthesis protein
MKYTLINCYADHNKGDLGIILATVGLITTADPSADIVAISTFNKSDPLFEKEHRLLRQEVEVLPAVFGELNICNFKTLPAKVVRLAFDFLRLIIYCLTPLAVSTVTRLMFSRYELLAIDRIIASDRIVSKGGSFLCNELDVRSKIALIRFLFIFFICIKHSKDIIILGQSIGPVYGRLSRRILNFVLSRCKHIVLREDDCISSYPYLYLPAGTTTTINDIAFFLDSSRNLPLSIPNQEGRLQIGVTMKYVDEPVNGDYIRMMKAAIEYCISKHNATIHIFPHVTIENDIGNSCNVIMAIDDRYQESIRLYSDDYGPRELKKLYSKMDFFIGTRLHSTIFAMGELIPSICIAYHGTKSMGIFSNFGLNDYIITKYSSDGIFTMIDSLIGNRAEVVEKIGKRLAEDKESYLAFLKKMTSN